MIDLKNSKSYEATNMNIYRDMTKDEHQELLTYLEEFLTIAIAKTYGYNDFMKSGTLKLCNDTFAELLSNDAIEAGI